MSNDPAAKFDPSRANEYAVQSRIALAGYDACHELSACMLAAAVGEGRAARMLVVGAGGGASEILTTGALEPDWRFVAVDPSRPMLDLAVAAVEAKGLAARTEFHFGHVGDLPVEEPFDAATLVGVLHHVPGDDAKRALLAGIARRLKPGAPMVLAGNRFAYRAEPLLLKAWGQRWRMHGASPAEVEAKLGKILEGADPPASPAVVEALLAEAGFVEPAWFFSSLFWAAVLVRRKAG